MTPKPAPRCPPVTETALIVSARSSSATLASSLSPSARRSAGEAILSRRGVAGFVTSIPEGRRCLLLRGKKAKLHQDKGLRQSQRRGRRLVGRPRFVRKAEKMKGRHI